MKNYPGEALSERLVSTQIAIGNNEIWELIGLCNELAHDANMKELDKKKTKQYLEIIRQVLFDLEVCVYF